jgi:hypothetical protein
VSTPTTPSNNPRVTWATIAVVAAHLGVTPKTIRNYIGRGYFPAYRIPNTRGIRLNLAEVDRQMKSIPTSVARAGKPNYGPLTRIIDMSSSQQSAGE